MATVADLITETRKHLYGSHRERRNRLNGAVVTADTQITLAYRDGVVNASSYLEIGEELLYVWEKNGDILDVSRGELGTTPASHSDQDIVRLEPRFPAGIIMSALLDEIRSWPNELLFDPVTVALAWPACDNIVDLTGSTGDDVVRVIGAQRPSPDDNNYPMMRPILDLVRDVDATVFASGHAVRLRKGYSFDKAQTVRVTYARAFDTSTWATTTDVNTDVGLTTGMNDIAPLGAAARLLAPTEIQRADMGAQPQSVDLQQVPPMYQLQAGQGLRQMADRRIHEEGQRMLARYPYKADG